MAKLTLKNSSKGTQQRQKKGPSTAFEVTTVADCHDGEFIAMLGPSAAEDHDASDDSRARGHHQGEIYSATGWSTTSSQGPGIGLAFVDYALYPPLSVYNNIAFNLRAKGLPMVEIDQRVRQISSF